MFRRNLLDNRSPAVNHAGPHQLTLARHRRRVDESGGERRRLGEEDLMFNYEDLFQWERFITPSIIKIFYWLAVAMAVLFGLSGILSGFGAMFLNPFSGLLMIFGSVVGVLVGVIFARIAAELILIVFRINEHLGEIRGRDEPR